MKDEFHTKIVGVTKKNEDNQDIQDLLQNISEYCHEGWLLSLEHERDNQYDENAIKVYCDGDHIGYIIRETAKDLAPLVDQQRVEAKISEITGGEEGKSFGCNILIKILQEGEIAQADSREHIRLGQVNRNGPSNARHNPEIDFVDPEELRSWPNDKFFSWANKFLEYGKNLPRTMDQETYNRVQNQLDIVNAEIARRNEELQSMRNNRNPPQQGNQPVNKDWVEKIQPVLPLVYVVWFCSIATGTFFLLKAIFI